MLTQDVLDLGFCAGCWGTQGPIIALPLSQVLGKDARQVPLAALHREVLSLNSMDYHPRLDNSTEPARL